MVELVDCARLAGSARTVATALRLARGRALAAGGSMEVRLDAVRMVLELRDGAGALLETRWLPAGVRFAALPARDRVQVGRLGTARNTATALALAGERLEALRVGPRAGGSDGPVAADGTRFVRTWSVVEGRGAPTRLAVRVDWTWRSLTLATEALP